MENLELETPTNGQSAAQIKAQKRLSIGAILAGIIAIAFIIQPLNY